MTDRPSDVPALSFLSTAYRTEAVIGRMIESVLAQTRRDWELVVVDNGCSDAVADAVRAHPDPRIRLVRQENRGMSGGFRAAADVARAPVVAPLCSDDLVAPEFVERVLAELDADPGLDAVSPDAELVLQPAYVPMGQRFAQGNPRLADPRPVGVGELVEGLLPYYCAGVRRATWDRVGGYGPLAGVEDRAFWLEVALTGGRIRLLDEPLGVYGVDGSSASHAPEKVVALEGHRERLLLDAARRAGLPDDDPALVTGLRHSRHRRALAAARVALAGGDAPGARAAARAALAQQRDPRTVLIAGALALAPAPVLVAHRWRNRLVPRAIAARERLSRGLAVLGRGRPGDRDGRSPRAARRGPPAS